MTPVGEKRFFPIFINLCIILCEYPYRMPFSVVNGECEIGSSVQFTLSSCLSKTGHKVSITLMTH